VGDRFEILCTVIVLTILVFGSLFEVNTLPPSEAQVSTTLTITTTAAGGYDIFPYSITGPTTYNTSIFTNIFVSGINGFMASDGPRPVDPGIYSIQELVPAGWTFSNAICTDGTQLLGGDTVSGIVINLGENIECTFENTILTNDADNDGIWNILDPLREIESNDFTDMSFGGTTSGTIITRGDQRLAIIDNDNPNGVEIVSDSSGLSTPATVSVCGGIATIDLDISEEVGVTCGSVTIDVNFSSVYITFIGSGGTQATTTISMGNSITFDQNTFSFSVPSTNTQDIIIDIDGTMVTLQSGSASTQSFGFLKITKLTTGGDDTFGYTVNGPTLYNPSITTAGGGGGSSIYIDTFSFADSTNDWSGNDHFGQLMTFPTPTTISSVTYRVNSNELSPSSIGSLQGVIYSGVTPGSSSFTVRGTSNEVFQAPWNNDGDGGTFIFGSDHNMKFTFNPPVTVSGSGIFVGVLEDPGGIGGDFDLKTSFTDIGGNEGICIEQDLDGTGLFTTYPNFDPGASASCSEADIVMKIQQSPSGGIGIDGPTPVSPGTYSIQETIPAGWNLTTATCTDGLSSFSVDTVSGIEIGPGDNIECTFEDELSSPDTDGDGIYNDVDTLPTTPSDDFSDVGLVGKSSGTITTRGDQILTITEEPNPAGVRIYADILGGTTPATVSVCGDASKIALSPGDKIIVTCGSVTIDVINGPVDATFTSSGGTLATTSITAGNSITFDPVTFSFSAPSTNENPVVVIVENQPITVTPGQVTSILSSNKDSFLKQGELNTNEGINTMMRVRDSGNNRALISFGQNEILTAAQGKTLQSATLRLYIEENGNNWGPTGRTIDVHRLLSNWSEGNGFNDKPASMTLSQFNVLKTRGNGPGVTWNCATDAEINNQQTNCSPQWKGATFSSTPTATITIFKDHPPTHTVKTVGWIEFDVKSDLQKFLSNTAPNYGWIVKKTQEGATGLVEFTSDEGTANKPELVLVFTKP
jgi:hypothetical protein